MDKTNLIRKVAELDDMVKTLVGTRNTQPAPQSSKTKACLLIFLFLVGSSYHFMTNHLSYVPFILLITGQGCIKFG